MRKEAFIIEFQTNVDRKKRYKNQIKPRIESGEHANEKEKYY